MLAKREISPRKDACTSQLDVVHRYLYTMVASSLSSSEQDALLAAAQVCASFSFIGSTFIICCFARYRELRKLSFTLVLFLAISDIGEPCGLSRDEAANDVAALSLALIVAACPSRPLK